MSLLLENIIFRGQKINFDMSKSIHSNLLNERITDVDSPIQPNKRDWLEENNVLTCSFEFLNEKHVIFFVNQILEKAMKYNHHPEIIINHKNVIVSLTTQDIYQVTEIDIEMAKIITDIYEDTRFIMEI